MIEWGQSKPINMLDLIVFGPLTLLPPRRSSLRTTQHPGVLITSIMTRSQTNCSSSIPHKALRMLKEGISLRANGSTPYNSSLCILQPQEYREVEVLFIDYIGPRGDAYKV
jgi:hypothetical protein